MLNINRTIGNGEAVFELTGRLDTVTSPELEGALKGCVDEAQSLTLDFSGLEYISSAGLRVLLSAQKRMSGKDGMKIVHVNETVMEIFDVTGFADILTIE